MTVAVKENPFCHEALLYESDESFFSATLAFIREGVATNEPTLVVLRREKNTALEQALGPDANLVLFSDMSVLGRNPAQIIPAWTRFLAEYASHSPRVRGIGEPIDAGRGEPELAECQRHEALLNVAFAGRPFTLLCPYDVSSLSHQVIAQARMRHQFVSDGGGLDISHEFVPVEKLDELLDDPLREPPAVSWLQFQISDLRIVRAVAREQRAGAIFQQIRVAEFTVAVNEVASNAIVHGAGGGYLAIWHERDRIVCEIRDDGRFREPLSDRTEPDVHSRGGRGLWLANMLCDLVQIRSGLKGTAVRLHLGVR